MPSFNVPEFSKKFHAGSLTRREIVQSLLIDRSGNDIGDIASGNGSVGFEMFSVFPATFARCIGSDPFLFLVAGDHRQELMDVFLSAKIFSKIFPETSWPNVIEYLYDYGGRVDAATAYFNRGLDRRFVVRYIAEGFNKNADNICEMFVHRQFGEAYWTYAQGFVSHLTPEELFSLVRLVAAEYPLRVLRQRTWIMSKIPEDDLRSFLTNKFGRGVVRDFSGLSRADLEWLPLDAQCAIVGIMSTRRQHADLSWLFALYPKVGQSIRQRFILPILSRMPLEEIWCALAVFEKAETLDPEIKDYAEKRRVDEGYLIGIVTIGSHNNQVQYEVHVDGDVYIHDRRVRVHDPPIACDRVIFKRSDRPRAHGRTVSRKFLTVFKPF